LIQLVVAFATKRHALEAVRFVSDTALVCGVPSVTAGDGSSFAVVRFEVEARNRERLATLVQGLHGIVMPDRAAEAVA
jgi:hypothetical protein